MKNKFDRFSRGQSLEAPTVPDAQRFGHSFKIIFKYIKSIQVSISNCVLKFVIHRPSLQKVESLQDDLETFAGFSYLLFLVDGALQFRSGRRTSEVSSCIHWNVWFFQIVTIHVDVNCRNFEALTSYLARYTRTFNWMIMLGFFTNTALQRLFTTQMTIPGTARITTLFTMSLKPNLPEVYRHQF